MCEYCGNTVVEERELIFYYNIAMRPYFDYENNAVCLATITGLQNGYLAAAERAVAEKGGIGAWVMVVDSCDETSIHRVDFCPKCGRQLN